jgi:hypothetical protein
MSESVPRPPVQHQVRHKVKHVAGLATPVGGAPGKDLAVTTPVSGWQRLSRSEYDQIWDRFEERFQFRASTDSTHWPGIREPVPSVTWDLAIDRQESDERLRSGVWRFGVDQDQGPPEADDDALNRLMMSALRDCVSADEWVYVLDWQHPAYHCWPHRVDPKRRTDIWPVQVFPDGDYYVFAAHDLRFGTFGHPWESTLCVWGSDLLDAVEARNAGVLTRLYRRDGKPVRDLWQP